MRPADQISVMSGFEIVSYSHSKPKYGADIQFPFFTEMKCLASYLPLYFFFFFRYCAGQRFIAALSHNLEWGVESTTVTHSSADWWDLLLPLA